MSKIIRPYRVIDDPEVFKDPAYVPSKVDQRLADMGDELLMELQEEGRQRKALAIQLGRFAQIDDGFRQAGVPVSPALVDIEQSYIDDMPLQGGIPAPYRGEDRRVHTTYRTNPATGDQEIVPYRDPVTGSPMVTYRGDVRDLNVGHEKASEYIGDQLLKLSGRRTVPNNQGRENVYKPDLIDTESGRIIDVEAKQMDKWGASEFPQQVYTQLQIINPKTRDMKSEMKELIRQASAPTAAKPNGLNMVEAVELLVDTGVLGPKDSKHRVGKLLKQDPAFNSDPDYVIDDIIMPGYTYDELGHGSRTGDTIVQLPSTAQLVSQSLAKDYIDNIRGSDLMNSREGAARIAFRGGNRGAMGTGNERVRLYSHLPNDVTVKGKSVAENLAKSSPMVQQLFKDLPYSR